MSDMMSYIDEITSQDERLNDPNVKAELIANNKGLDLERLVKIGKGSREIHWVEINGDKIPFRILSLDEEAELQHDTIKLMAEKYPLFKGALYNVNYEKRFLIKQISLATSKSIERSNDRFFNEESIGALTPETFAALVTEYQRIAKEYNPVIDQIDDDQVNFLIARLLDPTKKSIIIDGLTSAQMRSILRKYSDILIELEGNTSIVDSLISTSSLNETTEKK